MSSFALKTDGISWRLYMPSGDARVCVLYLQGFPSSGFRSKYYPFFANCLTRNIAIATVSYPGIQDSDGFFSGSSSLLAVKAVLNSIRSGAGRELYGGSLVEWHFDFVVGVGTSFGATLSLCTSGFDAVVACSPVTDWSAPLGETDEQMAVVSENVFPHTIRLAQDWNDWGAVSPIDKEPSSPCLVIHAREDPIVYFAQSKDYCDKFGVELVALDSSEHITISDVNFDILESVLPEFFK